MRLPRAQILPPFASLLPASLKPVHKAVLSPSSQPLVRLAPQLLLRVGYRTATVLDALVYRVPELKRLLQIAGEVYGLREVARRRCFEDSRLGLRVGWVGVVAEELVEVGLDGDAEGAVVG
jgi:hypothetical protein